MGVENNAIATTNASVEGTYIPAREPRPLYEVLSSCLLQRENCKAHWNEKYFEISTERILSLVKEYLPSGSGVDSGTTIDLEKSTSEKFVFQADFHHMDDFGSYAGWSEHTVTIKPSLFDKFTVSVSGRNRNDIKDHLAEMFYFALREKVTE
jgi:hypothetical protein